MIGNDLHHRKYQVVFVTPASALSSTATPASEPHSGYDEAWLRIDAANEPLKEIEEDIVAELVKRHDLWVDI